MSFLIARINMYMTLLTHRFSIFDLQSNEIYNIYNTFVSRYFLLIHKIDINDTFILISLKNQKKNFWSYTYKFIFHKSLLVFLNYLELLEFIN